MGPKYKSGGEDEHNGKWSYAGDADVKDWATWKDHSNNQGEDGLHKSLFEYRDGNNIGNKSHEFPDVGYQENPHKE